MKLIIGIVMLAVFFVGIFIVIGQIDGYREAIKAFLFAFIGAIFLIIAVFLIGTGLLTKKPHNNTMNDIMQKTSENADELARLVDVAEQVIRDPESKAAMAVLRNAVMFYREKGI